MIGGVKVGGPADPPTADPASSKVRPRFPPGVDLPCAMVRTPPAGGFWALLGERERGLLMAAGHERRVAPGRRLYDEGERAPSLVVIMRGRVKVSSLTIDGEERLL